MGAGAFIEVEFGCVALCSWVSAVRLWAILPRLPSIIDMREANDAIVWPPSSVRSSAMVSSDAICAAGGARGGDIR